LNVILIFINVKFKEKKVCKIASLIFVKIKFKKTNLVQMIKLQINIDNLTHCIKGIFKVLKQKEKQVL